MGVNIESSPDGLIARLSGEIDHHSARQIREKIDAEIEKTRPKKLLMDFEQVLFMDSSGVGLIMGRYKLMQIYGGKMKIIGASERIKKVISLAGIERLGIFCENTGVSR